MAKQHHPTLFADSGLRFGANFLSDYAGSIMEDPRIALVELIANCYDAGATQVTLIWPEEHDGTVELRDNGTGMTFDQLEQRWQTLSYNRVTEQGELVEFPPKTRSKSHRHAFGQNGKGRFGAFCFSNANTVETWKNGELCTASVELAPDGTRPFRFTAKSGGRRDGHGTAIQAQVTRRLLSVSAVSEAIGSKFLVDPTFSISINATRLDLFDLKNLVTCPLEIEGQGTIKIHQIHAATTDRTTQLKGITWWVNGRMVGEPSWSGLEGEGAILDGRTVAAKTYGFVIEADLLRGQVKQDWSAFHGTEMVNAVTEAALKHVISTLRGLLYQTRKDRKKAALRQNRDEVSELSPLSQRFSMTS
jgi:hypothetical protein